jgi:hypothetical protein
MYSTGDIRICPDNGYLLNGSFTSDGSGGHYFWRFFLKTDEEGNFEWDMITQDGCTIDGFVVLEEGSFIIVGWDIFNSNQYIQKRNLEGEIVWTTLHNNNYGFNSVALTNDGNIISTGGSTDGTINIQKFDMDGNLLWRQTYNIDGYEYATGNSIVQTNNNCYAITGIAHNTTNESIVVLKTDEFGEHQWTQIFNEQTWNASSKCIINNNNELFISGALYSYNESYSVLIKLNEDGEIIFYFTEQNSGIYMFNSLVNTSDGITGINSNNLYSYSVDGECLWAQSLPENSDCGYGDRCLQKIENGYIFVGTQENDDYIFIAKANEQGDYTSVNDFDLPDTVNWGLSNFPNPFNPTTTIEFSIQNDSQIELVIFNTKGQKVKTLADRQFTPGPHSIIWNGEDESGKPVSSGIYFYKLQVNGKMEAMKKCLLLK